MLGETYNELTTSSAQSRLINVEPVEFASQVYTQRRGRPAFDIKEEQLSFLLDGGFTVSTIALLFKVSTRTVERRMALYGLSV